MLRLVPAALERALAAVGGTAVDPLVRGTVSLGGEPAALRVLQLDPATGPPTAVVGTFLLAAFFYAFTAHLAARYVLGSVPVLPAAGVGVVLAAVALLLRSFGPAPVIAVSLAVDVAAIKGLYGLGWRDTALVTLAHYAASAILGITVFNLVRLLATAPG